MVLDQSLANTEGKGNLRGVRVTRLCFDFKQVDCLLNVLDLILRDCFPMLSAWILFQYLLEVFAERIRFSVFLISGSSVVCKGESVGCIDGCFVRK